MFEEKHLSRIADAIEQIVASATEDRLASKERMERFDREHAEDRAFVKEQREQQRAASSRFEKAQEEDRARMRRIDEERGREPRSPHPNVPAHYCQFPANFSAGVRFCGVCGVEGREVG